MLGSLTPWTASREPVPGVVLRSQTPERNDFTVHGLVPLQPWEVSFLGCRTTSRRANALGVFTGGTAHQVIRAEWAVAGAHVDTDTAFSGFRLQITGLEEWAGSPGLEQQMQVQPTLGSTISWTTPEKIEVPFIAFDEQAKLSCDATATFATIDVHGGHVATSNWLTLTQLSGWTLQEMRSRFIVPVQTLMTILTGQRVRVRRLEAFADDRWCPVFCDLVEMDALHTAPTRGRRRSRYS